METEVSRVAFNPRQSLHIENETDPSEQSSGSCFTSFCRLSSLNSSEDTEEASDVDSDQESDMTGTACGLCQTIASFFTSIFAYIAGMFCNLESTANPGINEEHRIRIVQEFIRDFIEPNFVDLTVFAQAYDALPEDIRNEIRKGLWNLRGDEIKGRYLDEIAHPTQEQINNAIDTVIKTFGPETNQLNTILKYLSSPSEQYPVVAFFNLFDSETPADAETVITAFRRLPEDVQRQIVKALQDLNQFEVMTDLYENAKEKNEALLNYLASPEGQRNHERIENIKNRVEVYRKVENPINEGQSPSFANVIQNCRYQPLYVKEQEIIEAFQSLIEGTKEKVLNIIYTKGIHQLFTEDEIPLDQNEKETFLIGHFASRKGQDNNSLYFAVYDAIHAMEHTASSEDESSSDAE
jgi:hypothetical protein